MIRWPTKRGMTRAVAMACVATAAIRVSYGTAAKRAAAGTNPIVSRGVPAYGGNIVLPPSNANNSTYFDPAASTPPCFVALDLSSARALGAVQVAWYNIATTFSHDLCCGPTYGVPQSYTLDANAAAGASPPSGGWITLASVSANHHNAGDFNPNLSGYHWLRMNVTAVDGSPYNTDASFQIDVQTGTNDSWLFGGDSITNGAMTQDESYRGSLTPNQPNFAQMVNAAFVSHFPLQIDAGIGGITATAVAGTYQYNGTKHDYMKDWLAAYPSHYVTLNYGTNDSNGTDPTTFYSQMQSVVTTILAAGRVPVIPTIPSPLNANTQALNAQIQALDTANPQIVQGPDLYAWYSAHPSEISADNIHPNNIRQASWNRLRDQTMVQASPQ